MQQQVQQPPYMPPPPAPKKERPWVAISIVVAAVIVVGGYVALNIPTELVGPATVTQAPTPSPSPSPLPLPEPDPVIVDPMDPVMQQLHEEIYIQQFCNLSDRMGLSLWVLAIETGKPYKNDTIGSSWIHAVNASGETLKVVATEFYSRYC